MRCVRLLTLGALLLAACGLAEDEQDERNKYIYLTLSDPAFETYCLEAFDTDRDGRLSRYEAQRVREITCPERGIGSLFEIAEFTRLERLDCRGNRLVQLDVSACPLLRTLDCSANALTALGLDGLRGLTDLNCVDNRLAALGLQSAVSLRRLDCRENVLTTLDVASCDAQLEADVRRNPDLGTVYCRASQSVSFDGRTQLEVR